MRTSADRSEKYTAKYVATTVGLKVASQLSGMKSGFAAAVNDLVPKEIATQALINGSGSQRTDYPFYLNFGRELWALGWKGIAGQAATVAATGIEVKYAAYGLDPNLLKSIALTVFGIVIP
jgi:hypothetical protein